MAWKTFPYVHMSPHHGLYLTFLSQDRLSSFMEVVHEWRHLKQGKRGGRTYDRRGLKATGRGELVVDCRTCPIPKANLPADYMEAPPERA